MNWNDLTMAQKNELMQTYIKNGVTSLDDMRSHFNSFAAGGPKNPPTVLPVNEEGLPYYTLPDIDIVTEALPQAKATDTNIQRYADAVAKGQLKLSQIPDTELRNRVRAVPIMNQWYKDMNRNGTIAAAGLASALATPYTIEGVTLAIPEVASTIANVAEKAGSSTLGQRIYKGISAMAPGSAEWWQLPNWLKVGTAAADMGFTAESASDLVANPNMENAINTGLGLTPYIVGSPQAIREARNMKNRVLDRTAEALVRQGDGLPQFEADVKGMLNYIIRGGNHPELAYKSGLYSGEDVVSHARVKGDDVEQYFTTKPHPGDVVDAFFNKGYRLEPTTDIEMNPKLRNYIDKNYSKKKKDIKIYDLGDFERRPRVEKAIENMGESDVITDVDGYPLVDVGGHITIPRKEGNKYIKEGWDIWKFKGSDLVKHHGYSLPARFVGNFIDSRGTPLVHTWRDIYPIISNEPVTPITVRK